MLEIPFARRLFESFLSSFQSQPKGCSFKDERKYPKNPPPGHEETLVDGALINMK